MRELIDVTCYGVAAALIFVSATGSVAFACTGTVLSNAEGGEGKSHVSIREGERLVGFTYLLRDRTTRDVVICNRTHCYPAFALDQNQQPREIIRLADCEISKASSNDNGLERRRIEDAGFNRKSGHDMARKLGKPRGR